ncbi:hypothetical protein K5X82_04195 [Halosquirtibacter xylanolyticus]|uniref:DUF7677 family protein n=1 Tax=Halosquirtibacter xylanolyticus TaxID=3374599 RepID=UPI003747BDF9|nr:hypothetical protein K5X82_04195 [Prolixibacteraceae bacterium]
MKLGESFSGALRTFAYFMASGSHYYISHLNYIELYDEEPSVIEQVFAIYANVIELDDNRVVINGRYAQERACQYIRFHMEEDYVVKPPYEEWETALWQPPHLEDTKL